MRHTPDFELIVTEKILQVSYATAYASYASAYSQRRRIRLIRHRILIRSRTRLMRLRILTEKMLQASCDSFDRRYLIYHRMFELTAHASYATAYASYATAGLMRLVRPEVPNLPPHV